jgi:hypothetical protein
MLGLLGAHTNHSRVGGLCSQFICSVALLTCHFILPLSDSNSLTGTIPTEIGSMTSLVSLYVCKLSSVAFHGHRPCWVFLERIPIIFELVGCAHNVSVRSPYLLVTLFFEISDSNSLTGTIPTEIGMMTSLVNLWISKLSSGAFHGHRPCWVILERIPIIFELVGCAHNLSARSPYLVVTLFFHFQITTPSPERCPPRLA